MRNFQFPISNFKFLILSLALFLIPQVAFAESRTVVDVETDTGGNTVCVNGECTTSSNGTSKSRVCVNGECFESDGDLHLESQNGETSVSIDNSSESSVIVEQNSKNEVKSEINIDEEVKGTSSKSDEEVATDAASDSDNKGFSWVKFVKDQLSFLRGIITFQFLFGDE